MRRVLQLQLSVEPPVQPNRRSLRRCYGCGNYTRPFVEMDGIIRCERCAKKDESTDDTETKDMTAVGDFGMVT